MAAVVVVVVVVVAVVVVEEVVVAVVVRYTFIIASGCHPLQSSDNFKCTVISTRSRLVNCAFTAAGPQFEAVCPCSSPLA